MSEPSSSAGPPRAGPAVSHGLGRALSRVDPEWVILRGVALPHGEGEDASPARVAYVLLHPDRGIALLDVAPGGAPDAVERVRRALAAARFEAVFAGRLPVVHLRLLEADADRLDGALAAAFARVGPIALRGGHAWTGLARRVLGGERVADPAPPGRGGQGHDPAAPVPTDPVPEAAGRRPAPRVPGLRALGYFWLVVVGVLAVGAALLHLTYEPPPPAGPAAGAGPGPAGGGRPAPGSP